MAGLWWSAVDVSHVTNSPQDVTALHTSVLAYDFKKMARYALAINMYKHQHRQQSHCTPLEEMQH